MPKLIDGKACAQKIKNSLKDGTGVFLKEYGRKPGLATVLVGGDPASQVYIRNKIKSCEEIGMVSVHHALANETSQKDLLDLIDLLNNDTSIDGILVQLPLPAQIDQAEVLSAIKPEKDVDGFHPLNMGRLMTGKPGLKPCTPFGVMKLLEETDIAGKHAVIIGRSNIVGKPVAMMLLEKNATVTICHSRTANLPAIVSQADIIVAAVGRAHFVKGDWVKQGAVVIDVGINRLPDGKLAGDVDFESVKNKASAITPVPGGVGPMTIAMLLWNTLEAAHHQVH